MNETSKFLIRKAYVEGRWKENLVMEVGWDGLILRLDPHDGGEEAEVITGYALPSMVNVHSHAFQRAMAGRAEYGSGRADSFWTWREVMYRFAGRMTPESLYHVARRLYLELLKGGYGAVCEFHYLHHRPDGHSYDQSAEMSLAMIRAARDTGLALCHLPVLYMTGGFDLCGLRGGQTRFGLSPDNYRTLWQSLEKEQGRDMTLGLAFHSLRAVPVKVIAEFSDFAPDKPRHIHIAEQQKEVEECQAYTGQRPVAHLLDHVQVNRNWCLVHATHMDKKEIAGLASTGAVAGVCPGTEGNLGDGLFPLESYLGAGGRIAVGSDSHVSRDVREELRWLEYGQRLETGRRTISASEETPHCGTRLYDACLEGGAAASGFRTGKLAPGYRADLVVLKEDGLALVGLPDEQLLDGYVFNGFDAVIDRVMVSGRWVLNEGRHDQEEDINRKFRETMTELAEGQAGHA